MAILIIGGIVYFAKFKNTGSVAVHKEGDPICYAYHQEATPKAPYKVDEYIKIAILGNVATGTKTGTQSGPDMTNGYTGTLEGTSDKDTINVLYSYEIEGSKNIEKEIYKVVPTGLEKWRYVLVNKNEVLTPDTTSEPKIIPYNTIDCKDVK